MILGEGIEKVLSQACPPKLVGSLPSEDTKAKEGVGRDEDPPQPVLHSSLERRRDLTPDHFRNTILFFDEQMFSSGNGLR